MEGGSHHGRVRRQPYLLFEAEGGHEVLHGGVEGDGVGVWHPVPYLGGPRVVVLHPGQAVGVPVPAPSGEEHAHVQGRHGDTHDGSHRTQQGPDVVGEDLEVPGVPGAGRAPRGGEPEPLAARPRVDRALLDLGKKKRMSHCSDPEVWIRKNAA